MIEAVISLYTGGAFLTAAFAFGRLPPTNLGEWIGLFLVSALWPALPLWMLFVWNKGEKE